MIKLLLGLIFIIITIVIVSFIFKVRSFKCNANKSKYKSTEPIIYLDNNGTTKIFNESLELSDYVYRNYYGNASAIYKLGSQSKKLLELCRRRMAKMLNCDATELFFTSGATESNNIAIRGIFAKHKKNGKHIITSSIEHPSVINTVKSIPDAEVTILSVDKYGQIDLKELENAIRQDTILVTIIHANNELGTIQDVRGISAICKRKKVHHHSDLTQYIGKYIVDLHDMGVDSAAISGHKFHSSKATGGLYLRNGVKCEACVQSGGGQESSIRSGTENIPGITSMAYSLFICYHLLGKGAAEKIKAMRDYMKDEINRNIPNAITNGHPTNQLYNTLSMCLPINSRKLINMLDKHNIAINSGSACSKTKLSSVLNAVGLSAKEQEGSIRISLGFLNTMQECKTAVKYIIHYTNVLLHKENSQEKEQEEEV
jgi:cysteine desulfurase